MIRRSAGHPVTLQHGVTDSQRVTMAVYSKETACAVARRQNDILYAREISYHVE